MEFIDNESAVLYAKIYRQDFEDFLQTELFSNKVDMENLSPEERQAIAFMDKYTLSLYTVYNYPKDWRRRVTLKNQGMSEEDISKTLRLEALNKAIGAAKYNPFTKQYEPLESYFYSVN